MRKHIKGIKIAIVAVFMFNAGSFGLQVAKADISHALTCVVVALLCVCVYSLTQALEEQCGSI